MRAQKYLVLFACIIAHCVARVSARYLTKEAPQLAAENYRAEADNAVSATRSEITEDTAIVAISRLGLFNSLVESAQTQPYNAARRRQSQQLVESQYQESQHADAHKKKRQRTESRHPMGLLQHANAQTPLMVSTPVVQEDVESTIYDEIEDQSETQHAKTQLQIKKTPIPGLEDTALASPMVQPALIKQASPTARPSPMVQPRKGVHERRPEGPQPEGEQAHQQLKPDDMVSVTSESGSPPTPVDHYMSFTIKTNALQHLGTTTSTEITAPIKVTKGTEGVPVPGSTSSEKSRLPKESTELLKGVRSAHGAQSSPEAFSTASGSTTSGDSTASTGNTSSAGSTATKITTPPKTTPSTEVSTTAITTTPKITLDERPKPAPRSPHRTKITNAQETTPFAEVSTTAITTTPKITLDERPQPPPTSNHDKKIEDAQETAPSTEVSTTAITTTPKITLEERPQRPQETTSSKEVTTTPKITLDERPQPPPTSNYSKKITTAQEATPLNEVSTTAITTPPKITLDERPQPPQETTSSEEVTTTEITPDERPQPRPTSNYSKKNASAQEATPFNEVSTTAITTAPKIMLDERPQHPQETTPSKEVANTAIVPGERAQPPPKSTRSAQITTPHETTPSTEVLTTKVKSHTQSTPAKEIPPAPPSPASLRQSTLSEPTRLSTSRDMAGDGLFPATGGALRLAITDDAHRASGGGNDTLLTTADAHGANAPKTSRTFTHLQRDKSNRLLMKAAASGAESSSHSEDTGSNSLTSSLSDRAIADLIALGSGTGATFGHGIQLDRDLVARMNAQDVAVVLLVVIVYYVSLIFGWMMIYRMAHNNSLARYYADPATHSLFVTSQSEQHFLQTFAAAPNAVHLRITGFSRAGALQSGHHENTNSAVHQHYTERTQAAVPLPGFSHEAALQSSTHENRDTAMHQEYAERMQMADPLFGNRAPSAFGSSRNGFAGMSRSRAWWRGAAYQPDFSVVLDLQNWVFLDTIEDRGAICDFLLSNELRHLSISKETTWENWEELATKVKKKLRSLGYTGITTCDFVGNDVVNVYCNEPWTNFVYNRATRNLCALSIIGLFIYFPYMYFKSRTMRAKCKYQVRISISEFWQIVESRLSATEGFNR